MIAITLTVVLHTNRIFLHEHRNQMRVSGFPASDINRSASLFNFSAYAS
jgi:hypothetical protein